MSDDKKDKPKGKLTLNLGARQSSSGGPKTVTVEVRKKRTINKPGIAQQTVEEIQNNDSLSDADKRKRLEILQRAKEKEEQRKIEEAQKQIEIEERQKQKKEEEQAELASAKPRKAATEEARPKFSDTADKEKEKAPGKLTLKATESKDWDSKKPKKIKEPTGGRKTGKITIANFDQEDRQRSLASIKRQREKAKRELHFGEDQSKEKLVREVIIPETMTVGELANRMSEKSADVIRELMKLGVMATINQVVDADTAELVVTELGHNFKRVTEGDVEKAIDIEDDDEVNLQSRPPVVTIMGHVDHGKTSLLDALRETDVVAGEAGGITQHIGAYQIELKGKGKITFIDTPGHAAFTEMRARGAKVTDIVILVVAADDGIKEQTKEAISHAKAAEVPIIVAINKIDKPDADIQRVKTELLQHSLVPDDMGGDILCIPVSAKVGTGLDDLKEAVLFQAEMLELKANPDRAAIGRVIESRVDKGRGVMATVVIQRGTLKVGDIAVAGTAFGKVRALLDDHGDNVVDAPPAFPVEILGLSEVPMAGDEFNVVESEKQAREIVEYRSQKAKNIRAAAESKSAMDKLMAGSSQAEKKQLAVVLKGDVHGSVEAIAGSLEKILNDEVTIRVIYSAVGGVTESDVTLANASNAIIVAFNVRANVQAKELANRDKIDIRYYSIIYEVVDDIKAELEGLLSPIEREEFIGYAEIREVFNITKIGKVAGCYVTEGHVKRGAGVRLLRDNVVIHEGKLKTLKRFKDEVKDVQNGYECGMAFESYDDVKPGDVIECYEVVSEAAKLNDVV
ncbi:MAG: translation initiation factor IF-2 [Alphaproteobacteria bacterium CG11_big_fil_rev_8_21_14_0_20_44_7]|nr:MAG: translation initiation factor IF-2 [Alphaproteobacteria bacterium CG11_big_fil_rev_8_21_14_0_20_44_7]